MNERATDRAHAPLPDNDVLVCYCFGETRGTIRREVERTGLGAVSERIRAELRAGRCACNVRNPKGTCCLRDVLEVEALAQASASAPQTADDEE